MKKSFNTIRTHSDTVDSERSVKQLMRQALPGRKVITTEDFFAVSDLDQSLVTVDMGVQTFLEKLKKPQSWQFKPQTMKNLLLPFIYQRILYDGTVGEYPDLLDPQECSFLIRLWKDIIGLYPHLYEQMNHGSNDLTVEDPIPNEFARKMLAMDGSIMSMDGSFIEIMKQIQKGDSSLKRFLNPKTEFELLLRTRLFAGHNVQHIRSLVNGVFENKDGEGEVLLDIHEENAQLLKRQRVTRDELPPITIGTEVEAVAAVRQIVSMLLKKDVPVKVVTTSIAEIAVPTIREFYPDLFSQNWEGGKPIVASVMPRGKGGYKPRMTTTPVFGEEKRKVTQGICDKTGRTPLMAIGDSPSNDVPMFEVILQNNPKGIVVIVAKDGVNFEETRQMFRPFTDRMEQALPKSHKKQLDKRIWYVTQD